MTKKMMKMMRTLMMLMSDHCVVVSLFGVLMPKGEKVPFACVPFGFEDFHLDLVGSQALISSACLLVSHVLNLSTIFYLC
jgi:hypothetical protein